MSSGSLREHEILSLRSSMRYASRMRYRLSRHEIRLTAH